MNSNTFSLISLQSHCYYSPVNVDFSPPPNPNKISNSIIPIFLKDQKFYTPAFVLPREKEYFETANSFEKDRFNEKLLKENRLHFQTSKHINPVSLTLPIPTSTYCQICRITFSCYNDHIGDPLHIRQSRFSKANSYTKQLCARVKKQRKEKIREGKTKRVIKNCKQNKRTQISQLVQSRMTRNRKKNQLIKGLNISTHGPSAIISQN